MMQRPAVVSIGILSALCGLACAAPDTTTHAPDQTTELELQRHVDRLLDVHALPGLSVALAESNRPLEVATAGFADVDRGLPVQPDTGFFVGSISKNIFATILLSLVEEERLGLDDPLSRFLEWPRADEISVRMLLNHTAGVPDYMGAVAFAGVIGPFDGFFSAPRRPAAILDMLPSRDPQFDPGTEQAYSNTNGLLVGAVIERVTGRTLADVLDERIVEPLGLEHTYLYGARTAERPRARGYCGTERWGATPPGRVDCSYADEALPDSADGSVVSTATDLVRYHQALRSGRLLGDAMWAAMRRREPGLDNGLGYLLMSGPLGDHEGNVGRAMGHVAASVYYADLDVYVALLANQGDGPMPLGPLMNERYGRP